ncbi:hypothetical protein HRG_003705 [Hirsutella rhossiliensis]|uniref:Ubiquitin-conjugating enzyme n=1 Tax=Hirsutella rhossiliensis TaxID=111463 RepID=A0A9P8SKX7_9HYPO|nr:uncharacterized protein HRG_03705 [Hirsutella rhossiliensis]KAH0965689.1 hypothetical protein HRG_03705 [Hirsutella rhossiliensis]
MAPISNQSPHIGFHTPTQQATRDKPSPLRIVKRSRLIDHHESSPKEIAFPSDDGVAGTSELLDRKFPLKIVKRRSRRKAPAFLSDEPGTDGWEQNAGYRPSFWASSVELSRPRGRVWEETLTRCRGLLTKSTPFLKDSRQPWTMGRSGAHRRAPSCRTASSGSSILDYADYTPSNGPPSSRQSFGARPAERPASPLHKSPVPPQSTPPLDFSRAAHPFVLSPYISVVSQCTGQEAGRQSAWATVEVSGRLSRIPSSRSPSGSGAQPLVSRGSFVDHQLDRFFEFGCLYDLSVEILPTTESAIVQVVQEQAFPTTIHAGSSVILLVHVQIDSEKGKQRSGTGHVRQKSDELIEDLELELGSSAVGFMHIRVSYSHSAFPEQVGAEPDAGGVSGLRSRMETTATASLVKQHNAFSMWSPRPEPLQSHILPLVQRHWGLEKAMSMKRLIMGQEQQQSRRLQRTCQGKTEKADALGSDSATARAPTTRAPARRASLHADRTSKASTLGPAVGKRAQRLLSPVPPSAPSSLRSSTSSEDARCYGGPLDPRNSGANTKGIVGPAGSLQRRVQDRVGTRRGSAAPTKAWAASDPEEGREAQQDKETLHGKPMKDTGFWNWGLWF